MQILNSISKIIAVMLLFCIIFTSCGSSYPKSINNLQIINTEKAENKFHIVSKNTKTVIQNEYIDLKIDEENHSVIVKDKQSGYEWNSLPENNNSYGTMFEIKLINANGIHVLNTQDNSVALSSSSFRTENNILYIDYILSDKEETTKKDYEELTANDIYVSFTASFTLKAQSLYLDINTAELKTAPESFISEITVMPYLGSSKTDAENDYFIIPDGSGAIMNLNTSDIATGSVTTAVYGADPYIQEVTECATATLPVFGAKRSDAAFVSVITNADALATINANRSDRENPSRIYSVFTTTSTFTDENNNSILFGKPYEGNISVVYKFLSGSNANYSAMALTAKEEFITNGTLSSEKSRINDTIPFCITLIGEADNKKLTTTQQAIDILRILKGKGISNIFLNYKGLLSGGLAQKNLYSSFINNKLGGEDGLAALHEFTEKQNCTLSIGINIISASEKFSLAKQTKTISSDKAIFLMNNDMSFYQTESDRLASRIGAQAAQLGKEKADSSIYSKTNNYSMYLLKNDKLKKLYSSFIEDQNFSVIDGLTLNDAGRVLYSDSDTTRQEAMNTVASLIRATSNYGSLGIEGGNLYALYNADIVLDMDFDTFYPESAAYEPIPFAQSILHGSMLYTGKPIDAGDPLYRYNMLRYIEYGAVPSYEWIYESANIYCYSAYLLSEKITEIVEFYNEAADIFSELADKNITGHRKVTKDALNNTITGVYCTTYSDGSEIYVNYTGNIVTTSENIVIGPYDYVKVNR